MSLSDPLGDMLTRIRNAQRARHSMCMSPASQLRANVLGVLQREGFIRGYSAEELRPGVARSKIELKYNEGDKVSVTPKTSETRARMMWGTTRALIANMVQGVSTGFTKSLEITGTGY